MLNNPDGKVRESRTRNSDPELKRETRNPKLQSRDGPFKRNLFKVSHLFEGAEPFVNLL